MKKIISLILAAVMLCGVALAETPDLGIIGGADGPTSIFTAAAEKDMLTAAVDAGRRVTVKGAVTEFAIPSTGDAEVDTAIADLVKALGFSVAMQGDEVDAALSLLDKDVLTMGWAVSGDDAYIKSNLIGGTVVLTAKDIEPLIGRLIDMLVLMEAMTEDDAAQAKKEMAAMFEQLETALEQAAGTAFTEEDLLALDYSALMKAVADLAEQVEEIENIVVPRMCDPATAGIRLSISNEEFIAFIRAALQFIKDNPKLMDYIAAQSGAPTEEAIAQDWEQFGDMYKEYGIYASEEEYREVNRTFAQALDDSLAALEKAKLLDGEFVTTLYVNDADELVYLTSVLPMFTADERLVETDETAEATGTTEILTVTYSRQTMAGVVSHVCNIDVDGDGISIEVQSKGSALTILIGDPAEQTVFLTINAVTEDGVTTGDFTTNEEEDDVVKGTFAFSHVQDDTQIKTNLKLDMDVTSVTTQEVVENSLANRILGTGTTTTETVTESHQIGVEYTCDYALHGVDFTGTDLFSITFDDVKVAFKVESATSDAAESIMAGEVVRPMELDDAAFANWFVGAFTAMTGWVGNLLTALPESTLMQLLSSGILGN